MLPQANAKYQVCKLLDAPTPTPLLPNLAA